MSSRRIKAIQQLVIKPSELDSIFSSLSVMMSATSNQNPLKDLFQEIGENVILPILLIPPDQIQDNFEKWIPPFQYKLKALIDVLKVSNLINSNDTDLKRRLERLYGEFQSRIMQDYSSQ